MIERNPHPSPALSITMTNFKPGDRVLVTTDNWFFAPNGLEYRAVFGTVKGVHTDEATLGIKTNSRSTNWYVEIGNMVIAGCQIHYAIHTESCNLGDVRAWQTSGESGIQEFIRPSAIYNADQGSEEHCHG